MRVASVGGKLKTCVAACALLALAAFSANAADAVKIRLQFVFDKGAMDYISQADADYDEFAASCVTRMNTVLANSRLNGYFTYELACTTLLPGVDNTGPGIGYTEGWAALNGNRGDEWAGMLQDRYNNAADVVVLLVNTGTYAGLTGNSHPYTGSGAEYAINYAGNAFSVCSIMTAAREIQGIANANQVLSHEVAHTLGCGHPDTQDRQPGPQSTAYAAGMQFKLPAGKETALPPSASVTQDITAYYGTTLMGYSERFFKNADGTYKTRAEVLAETGWTDEDEETKFWDNTGGANVDGYPKGVWTYCYIVPYFSSPNLYFSTVTVPYGMELADGVVTVYDQAQYDAMSAEDKAKLVPMGDETHNNRQVLIDNCRYASRWHLGVKFSKEGGDSVVNGKADKITLTPLSKDLTIYYTTDGTEPTKDNGTLYTAPFSLAQAATVKARSYDASGNAGDVLSKSYTMLPLATALGNTELTWTVGDYPWYVEEGVARSRKFAFAEAGNQSVLTATIVGPATVNFDYKVLSAGFAMSDYADKFIAMLDGVEYLSLKDTNVDDWSAIDSIEVPSGEHTLSLVFNLNEYWGDAYAAVRNVSVIYDYDPETPENPEEPVDPETPAVDAPVAAAVWENDFGAMAFSEFDGYRVDDWNETHGDYMSTVTIDRNNQGLLVDFAESKGYVTVLVKYSDLAASASNKRVLFATTPNSDKTRDRCGIRLQTDGKVIGLWNASLTANNDGDYGSASTGAVPSSGTLAFIYDKGASGTSAYVAGAGETLPDTALWNNTALKSGDIWGFAVGGMCREAAVAGVEAAKGMTISGLAVFDKVLTVEEINAYKWPSQLPPVDKDKYAIDPAVVWCKDFKTTTKGDYTLSTTGSTVADDTYGSLLTIGDAAAVIDTTAANSANMTVLIKYRAASSATTAPVVAFGGMSQVGLDVGVYTKSDKTLAVYRNFSTDNSKPYSFATAPTLSANGGYVLCARNNFKSCMAYVGDSLDAMTGGEVTDGSIQFSNVVLTKLGIGGNSGVAANANDMVPFTGFVVEKVVVFNGYYTPDQIRYVSNPEEGDSINIPAGATWKFAAGETRTYTNIGLLNEGGAIAITNAAALAEGVYTLVTWTTAQKKSTGYGRVALNVDGIPTGLSAELVYGAKAIYLRVWNKTTQAGRGTIKVWPYGDSITEGFNAGGTKANYRVLLAQKLSMLGYNVEMVGCYDTIDGAAGIDPSGQAIPDAWKWHSAKHGATAGPTTSATGRANLCENVDTLSAQAGNPDVVLLLAGANDIVPATGLSAEQVVSSVTNIVAHLAANLPETVIVVGNQINVENGYNSANYNNVVAMIPRVNALLRDYVDNLPEELAGKVFLADLNSYVKSGEYGILFDHTSDHLHPDWWGHDQMAEGWLSVITNKFTATQVFPSATVPAVPADEELGAAAKSELAAYRKGFKLARRIDVASNLTSPYSYDGNGITEGIEKVGYFVEYVRADNNAHKWVWVDMDAFGKAIGEVGLPAANHQQAVTKLHVKSNHNGIDDVAPDNDTVTGFIEFSPCNYNGNVSGVSGAPDGNASCYDWNDTLYTSGTYGCMQVHRVFSPAKPAADGVSRGGQVLFAYNNWQSSSTTAEFGIGNFSQHFHRGTQTFDYTYTSSLSKMNADAYSVKRIEIWTKGATNCLTPEELDTEVVDEKLPLVLRITYTPEEGGDETTVDYQGVLKAEGGKAVLNPEGVVNGGTAAGIPVDPQLDEADSPFTVDGEDATFTVKTIPGLWYSVMYGADITGLVSGGSGVSSTEPKQAKSTSTELSAPKEGGERFYRVKVSAKEAE